MRAPHFVMTGLYLLLAALVTLDSALASLGWLPALAGIRWLRVHFITLGVLTQLVFGLLPVLTAKGLSLPKPKLNWRSWLLYNGGLILLLIGLPVVDRTLIISGGTLVFSAVLVLMQDLIGLRRDALARQGRGVCASDAPTRFYLGGLAYLLVGVLVGTGMWIGWAGPLRIAIPKEVHVHANLWGFTALVFAGLLFDLFPTLAKKKVLGRVRLDAPVFAAMALGALGLVIGPWLDVGWPAVAGLALHTLGTLLLLVALIGLALREGALRQAGVAHLVSAYLWLLVPVVVAPYIVAKASERFPVGEVAGNGGPILIYGWILTFSLAVIPYFFSQVVEPDRPPGLGGSWLSLVGMHLGSILFWLALFVPGAQAGLRAGAFLCWFAALLPLLRELSGQSKERAERREQAAHQTVPRDTTLGVR